MLTGCGTSFPMAAGLQHFHSACLAVEADVFVACREVRCAVPCSEAAAPVASRDALFRQRLFAKTAGFQAAAVLCTPLECADPWLTMAAHRLSRCRPRD